MQKKVNYRYIDVVRAMFCVAVLMYHLGVLPGGYLAVCGFFCLSGFLTARSFIGKLGKESSDVGSEQASTMKALKLGGYYIGRFKRLYLPLLVAVLASLAVITFMYSDALWLSLKPETISVLGGYNNFWQIEANLDYFARHSDSPFMHLWYIAIQLQFDLVFPLAFAAVAAVIKNRKGQRILWELAALGFTVYFVFASRTMAITAVYYNTLTRLFSLLWGVAGAYALHKGMMNPKLAFSRRTAKGLFWLVSALNVVMYLSIPASSPMFAAAMIMAGNFCLLQLLCALLMGSEERFAPAESKTDASAAKKSVFDTLIQWISGISYEIYLVQYPIIYVYDYYHFESGNVAAKVGICTALTLVLAALLHFGLGILSEKSAEKSGKKTLASISRGVAFLCIIAVTCVGGYQFAIAEDHTEQMKQLEAELAASAEELKARQEAFAAAQQADQDHWAKLLEEMESNENALDEMVKNLPITAIGDSVMLGASGSMYDLFTNIYCDAAQSRTAWVVNDILVDLKSRGLLADTVLLHFGTNGDAPAWVKDNIMKTLEGCTVFWVNVTNDKDVHVNEGLKTYVEGYENAHYIDWVEASANNPEWFVSDGIHLNEEGRTNYARVMYEAILKLYKDRWKVQKEQILAEHQAAEARKISFYGNDLLLNIADLLAEEYPAAGFSVDSAMTGESLIAAIESDAAEGKLPGRVAIAADSSAALSADDLMSLVQAGQSGQLKGLNVLYVLNTDPKLSDGLASVCGLTKSMDSVTFAIEYIDFSGEITAHSEYLMADKKHLSESGRKAAAEALLQLLK